MAGLPVRILVADIGGTNCRFGLFVHERQAWTLAKVSICPSSGLSCSDDFLDAMQARMDIRPQSGDALALAIAGPVQGDAVLFGRSASLTNGSLVLDADRIRQRWSTNRCLLFNDFVAQAHACLSPAGQGARQVAGPVVCAKGGNACRAVLGAGTGLGAATLQQFAGQWHALPSEFGHTAFAFHGTEEVAFQTYLCHRCHIPCATCEDVLSGRGLAWLHAFLTGQEMSPAEVGRTALDRDSATLRLFARFYARACRHWILSSLCLGGLWISGGIAQANPLCIDSPCFLQELYGCSQMAALLRSVPICLLTDALSGLWGAAWALLSVAEG
ncbi:MAG: glucokinase [Desulfovibrio sp.]|nr:glucokinase [Desulfovibrio sp.]